MRAARTSNTMKILFIHKNYPAQFGRLAHWLDAQGWEVTFATARNDVQSDRLNLVNFQTHREPSEKTHHYLIGTERAVLAGQGLVRTAVSLRDKGYKPDIVVAHSGWGVGFFVKDVWPKAKYVQYAEWYYSFPHADQTPYFASQNPMEERAKARIRNAPFWLDFSAADATVCPTYYQASRFPVKVQDQITVLNDGFDTKAHRPAPRDPVFLAAQGIPPEAKLVTYIARGMEPTRGFPEVMKAITALQKQRDDVHAVVIADDRVAYGPKTDGASWKERMLESLDPDLTRIHFAGLVPRASMIKYLQASDAHLYLSAPFVLSWSFIEAMACAAPVVAARSAPVEEFMIHGESGLLVDPFATDHVVRALQDMLDFPEVATRMGAAARKEIVEKYDGEAVIFPRAARFFGDLLDTSHLDNTTQSNDLPSEPNAIKRSS